VYDTLQAILIILTQVAMLSILWSTIRYGISPMPSNALARKGMLKLVPDPEPTVLIELGSGWGNFANQLAQQHPECTVIGYERSIVPFLIAALCFRKPNLQFQFKDFLKVELPEKALFFCYLYPKGMNKLSDHLHGTDCWLISNTFSLPTHDAVEKIQLQDTYRSIVYLYQIRAKKG